MKSISINLTANDLAQIERVAADIPLTSRHAIARAALVHGLGALVRDPDLAMRQLKAIHDDRPNRAAP